MRQPICRDEWCGSSTASGTRRGLKNATTTPVAPLGTRAHRRRRLWERRSDPAPDDGPGTEGGERDDDGVVLDRVDRRVRSPS